MADKKGTTVRGGTKTKEELDKTFSDISKKIDEHVNKANEELKTKK